MKHRFFLLTFIILSTFRITSAQTPDATAIATKIKDKFKLVKDFSANVTIKVDVEFLKAPDSKAKLYFKQPNKTKLESTGFAMLPKQGIGLPIATLLEGDYTALYVGTETLNSLPVTIIKIIPASDTGDVILSSLWVDGNSLVRKIKSSTRKGGTVIIELAYGQNANFSLPATVKITFDLPNFALPKTLTGDISSDTPKTKTPPSKTLKGSATLTYSNYQINKGLQDSFFDEKKK
ncbi:MAG: hypothetical protein IPM69_19425 [Ignavibacteria bacterium]|nr:hypothetical protein [Ignavibacteria bacterium]